MKLKKLYTFCHERDTSFIRALIKHVYYKLRYSLNVVCGNAVQILSPRNIHIHEGRLEVGFVGPEFVVDSDKTLIFSTGSMIVSGRVLINKGSRICVVDRGGLTLNNCFINSNVVILCEHNIHIGSGTAIGWGTQICDEDYHRIKYAKNVSTNNADGIRANGVRIGNNVLICNNCHIYKGVEIADGCVVASDTIIKQSFRTPNMLIAGNPAREIKKIESWQ